MQASIAHACAMRLFACMDIRVYCIQLRVLMFLLSLFLIQGIAKLQEDLRTGPQSDTFQSNVYCHLGHLHLLLEEYHEGTCKWKCKAPPPPKLPCFPPLNIRL